MRRIEVQGKVAGRTAREAFDVLVNFEAYQSQCSAVRSVTVQQTETGERLSKWEVNFREGVLQWTEQDEIDYEQHVIRFRKVDGDPEEFSGSWSLSNCPDGCRVSFSAEFDLGLGGLRDVVEPIAQEAMEESVREILTGMLGPIEYLEGEA